MISRRYALPFFLFMPLVLVACGSQRDPEFSDDDPDEQGGETVAVNRFFDGQFQSPGEPLTDTGGKRLEVMDNEDDFFQLLDAYTDDFVSTPDFTQSQVLLYDAGWVDDNECAQQTRLRQVSAETLRDDPEELVQVTLEFDFKPADDSASDCTDEELLIRPFEFIRVDTRAELLVVEQLRANASNSSSNGDDEGTSSTTGSE